MTKIKDIPKENLNEIIQDALFFTLFLRIKKNMSNEWAKVYMVMFLKQVASIFLWEFATVLEEYGGLPRSKIYPEKEKYNNLIKDERGKIKQRVKNSNLMKSKIDGMGIEYNNLIYDLNIVLNDNGRLLDFNFEGYNENEDIAFWNGVFLFPETVLKIASLGDLDSLFEGTIKSLKPFTDILEKNISGTPSSYSSNKLFKNCDDLNDEDKTLILFRYRLVESISLIGEAFPKVEISLVSDTLNLSLKRYLRKYRALVIEIIGKELMALDTIYSDNLLESIHPNVPKTFYSINRKLRNNIHYTEVIKNLTDKENELLDKYQHVYLGIITGSFNKCLSIELDDEYQIANEILKECREKGMSFEETKEIYEELFLEKWHKRKQPF